MRRSQFSTVLLLVIMLASVFPAGETHAAAWTKWTKPPEVKDLAIVGEAEVSIDCEGTFGCHAYIKLEFRPEGGKPWRHVEGRWVTEQGRNKIYLDPGAWGCGDYRLVVDTYNDVLMSDGETSVSSSSGKVSVSTVTESGSTFKRIHVETTSPAVYICPAFTSPQF